MKNLKDLNQKIGYRLIKVIYIILFLIILIFGNGFIYDKYDHKFYKKISYSEYERISEYNYKSNIFNTNNRTENNKLTRINLGNDGIIINGGGLVQEIWDYKVKIKKDIIFKMIFFNIIFSFITYLIFLQIINRIFYYIIFGTLKPNYK